MKIYREYYKSLSIETWCVDALSSSSCQAAAAGAGSTALDPARPPPSRRRRSLQRHPEVVARAAGDDRDVLLHNSVLPVGGRREQERQPAERWDGRNGVTKWPWTSEVSDRWGCATARSRSLHTKAKQHGAGGRSKAHVCY